MGSRLIIDGNAVYEIDEDCIRERREKEFKRGREGAGSSRIQETEGRNYKCRG